MVLCVYVLRENFKNRLQAEDSSSVWNYISLSIFSCVHMCMSECTNYLKIWRQVMEKNPLNELKVDASTKQKLAEATSREANCSFSFQSL